MKNQHEEFLRRIPVSPSHSPPASLIASPANVSSPLPQSPTEKFSGLTLDPGTYGSPSLRRPRHTRKISVSQHDIALLSDQNAELLSKLERLESEAVQSDQFGRRKLRKLEKDIQILREELEKTQSKTEEREEKARADNARKKKMERQEKIKARRDRSNSDPNNHEVKDFAPKNGRNIGVLATPINRQISNKVVQRQASAPFEFPLLFTGQSEDKDDAFSFSSSNPVDEPSSSNGNPQRELVVISQLLLKIQELEEANSQISEQQAKTAYTLRSVQTDAANIKRVYESLSDSEGIEWELVPDDGDAMTADTNGARPIGDQTIRFRSFRRSIEGVLSDFVDSGYLGNSLNSNMQSTVNNAALNQIIAAHKTRKSVVGLFDIPLAPDISPPTSESDNAPIPALSDLSSLPGHANGPTLGTELGSQFGDSWRYNGVHHHLYDMSLYQSGSSRSSSPTPSSQPVSTPNESLEQSGIENPHSAEASSFRPSNASTVARASHLTDRYRRMSQTVRSRSNRWEDGRFKDTLLSPKNAPKRLLEKKKSQGLRTLTPIPQRLASAFDSMISSFGPSETNQPEPAGDEDHNKSLVKTSNSGTVSKNPTELSAISKVVVELWIWLQFIIIILVFLWAVAKRGPRNVVGEAERKRALSVRQS